MSKRAHADEIIKWASDEDAVVFYRFGGGKWSSTSGGLSWLHSLEYKTILPEYAEAWQAWLDGELQIRDETGWFAWFAVDDDDVPGFDLDPEEYRRIPKESEVIDTVYEVSPVETELAELKAQHELALKGWGRERSERMRLEGIVNMTAAESKTNDHLEQLSDACKAEMERPAARAVEEACKSEMERPMVIFPSCGNDGQPSVADGLRKLLAARDETLKERDSELVAANARAEYWKRQANGKITRQTGLGGGQK